MSDEPKIETPEDFETDLPEPPAGTHVVLATEGAMYGRRGFVNFMEPEGLTFVKDHNVEPLADFDGEFTKNKPNV